MCLIAAPRRCSTALLAGEVQVVIDPITTSLVHIQSGKMRAARHRRRRPARRPCRTCRPPSKRAIRSCSSPFWLGVVAPAGTPPAIIAKLNAAFREAWRRRKRARGWQLRRRGQDRHAGGVRQDDRRRARVMARRRQGRQHHRGVTRGALGAAPTESGRGEMRLRGRRLAGANFELGGPHGGSLDDQIIQRRQQVLDRRAPGRLTKRHRRTMSSRPTAIRGR